MTLEVVMAVAMVIVLVHHAYAIHPPDYPGIYP